MSDLIQKSLILSNSKNKANSLIEESVNFFADLSTQDIDKSAIQTFLVTNISYNGSDSYGYMITMNGDIFFYRQSPNVSTSQKKAIWHLNINALIISYFKVDINVIFNNTFKC